MFSMRHTSADTRSKIAQIWRKKVNIVEFHDHIWNHHEKYIGISIYTQPVIGSLIHEIAVKM